MLFRSEIEVIQLAQHFLIYALFFQLSDAIAAPIQGALRGYKDVNVTLITAFVSYWIIGLPAGFYMAFNTEFGAAGYWIGLILGIAVSAVGLSWRLILVQRRYGKRESKA